VTQRCSAVWLQSEALLGRVHFKFKFELVSGVLCISARALDNLNLEAKAATSSAAGGLLVGAAQGC
jgi:hypothetical protein